jgi:hypothetical protein
MHFAKYCLFGLLLLSAVLMTAQDSDKSAYVASATTKFTNFPGVPECFTGAAQQGDPSKGDAVLLLKGKAGCVIPWHWHTPLERLMMVSGRAKLEMKDGLPVTLHPGDFVNLVSKHAHQFTCQLSCTLFDVSTGAPFDIHYVDASGNEIPAEQATKPKASAAKKPKTQ